MNLSGKVMCFCVENCTFSVHLVKDFVGGDKIIVYTGRVPKKKSVFFMVFCQTGGRGVSEGSEKTILLF